MTFADMPGAAQIGKLSQPLLDGLRLVLTAISATWAQEHTAAGGHAAVTATTVTTPYVVVDANTTAGETAWLVSVAGGTPLRVSVGAADSGGVGYRLLRVVN